MRLTNQEVAKIVLECCKKCGCESFIDKLSFRWNFRMRTTMGRATITAMTGLINPATFTITLNPHLFDRATQEKQRNTVIHEACHLIDGFIHGKMDGHGYGWKTLMRRCGQEPVRCHSVNTNGLKRTHKIARVEA